MSRKEAKQWIKAYREQTGCSKKEAKAAFESIEISSISAHTRNPN